MSLRLFRLLGAPALLWLVVAGCSGDPLGPYQPEVNNATDNFQLQATGVQSVSHVRTYTWTNTGTRATVNHSTTTNAGNAHITIRDAAGIQVYDADLVPSLNVPTATGTAGAWRIELRLTGYSGTLNFRVQKL